MPLDDLANNYFAVKPLFNTMQVFADANRLAVADPDCFGFVWDLDGYVDPFGHDLDLGSVNGFQWWKYR